MGAIGGGGGGGEEEEEKDDDEDEADDDGDDYDDPDGAVRLGGGGVSRRDDDDDNDDDDDSDSDSDSDSLEPYDMTDDEDDDGGGGAGESKFGDAPAAGAVADPAVAKRARLAVVARATRKRIAALPRPTSLSQCVEWLRQARGGDDTASSKTSVDRADAAEGAVHAAESLIRAAPEELIGHANDLVAALVHAHPATPDDEPLAVARRRALCAVAATAPGVAGPALSAEAFASGRCDAGQRLEVLDAIADAARELAALPSVAIDDVGVRNGYDASVLGGTLASGSASTTRGETPRPIVKVGRERRFAPKSLERLRRGAAGAAPTARRTRAHLVGGALAGPLLIRVSDLLKSAAADASKADAYRARPDASDDDVHVPGGGIDALVLARALGALGECCAAARNAPDAAAVAAATLELSVDAVAASHSHPHVRSAAFFAAYGAITAVPPAAAYHALADATRPSALGYLLARAEEMADEARSKDPDEGTRGLALRCALAAGDLQQRAVALASGGGGEGGRDDPMYLLKNLTSLAIGGFGL